MAKKQKFSKVKNAYVRIVDTSKNDEEICRYNLTDNYSGKTAVIFGEVFRDGGEWKFNAVGEGFMASYINEVAKKYV